MLHFACYILHGRDTGEDLPHVGVFVEHAEDLQGKGEGRSFYTLAVWRCSTGSEGGGLVVRRGSRGCRGIHQTLVPWSWRLQQEIPEWETMFKRKVLARALVWYMLQYCFFEECSVRWVFSFCNGNGTKLLLFLLYCNSFLHVHVHMFNIFSGTLMQQNKSPCQDIFFGHSLSWGIFRWYLWL